MPQGRWYPYVGIGGGAQRARLSLQGYEETSYSPSIQALGGIKFFVIKLSLAKRSGRRAGTHLNMKRTPIGNATAFQQSIWLEE
jgi:hypothetical protein